MTISFTATMVLDWLSYLVKLHPLDLVMGVLGAGYPQKLLFKFKYDDHLGKSNEILLVTVTDSNSHRNFSS